MKEKWQLSPAEKADCQLDRMNKRAKMLLRAAKRGGPKSAHLADAGARLLSQVVEHRVAQVKAQNSERLAASLCGLVRELIESVCASKGPQPVAPKADLPGCSWPGTLSLPREVQIVEEIRTLSQQRREADAAQKGELEGRINALRDEYLALQRSRVKPDLRNYRQALLRRATEPLAELLVALAVADEPAASLEQERDRLGDLIARVTELNAMDDLRAAAGPEETA